MNAAGLFKELIGAPFRIMPPKIATRPDTRPISVDFSKKIPLFPNARDTRRLLQRRLPTCIQHSQMMQMIFAAFPSLLAADLVSFAEHLRCPSSYMQIHLKRHAAAIRTSCKKSANYSLLPTIYRHKYRKNLRSATRTLPLFFVNSPSSMRFLIVKHRRTSQQSQKNRSITEKYQPSALFCTFIGVEPVLYSLHQMRDTVKKHF